jgi:hypothetical protein
MRASSIARPRPALGARGLARRLARALAAVLLLLPLAGCLRVRETFVLEPDLSGRVTLEVWVPSAFLPGGSASARSRLGSEDLVLPAGVALRRHAVDEDARGEVRFELVLEFRSLEALRDVALRYPGSAEPPRILPWRGLSVRKGATMLEIERAAYGVDEISAELLASQPEGRLAAESFRLHTLFAFDAWDGGRWIAPSGGWQPMPGSARRRWSRVRAWGDHLRSAPEPLRALLPLDGAARLQRVALGSLRGLLAAAPWIAIALALVKTRPRSRAPIRGELDPRGALS